MEFILLRRKRIISEAMKAGSERHEKLEQEVGHWHSLYLLYLFKLAHIYLQELEIYHIMSNFISKLQILILAFRLIGCEEGGRSNYIS